MNGDKKSSENIVKIERVSFILFNFKALKTPEFGGLPLSYRLIIAWLISTQAVSVVIPGSTGTGIV